MRPSEAGIRASCAFACQRAPAAPNGSSYNHDQGYRFRHEATISHRAHSSLRGGQSEKERPSSLSQRASKRGLACARAMLPIQKDFAHSGHHLHVMTEQKYNTIIDWLSRTLFAVVTEGTAMS